MSIEFREGNRHIRRDFDMSAHRNIRDKAKDNKWWLYIKRFDHSRMQTYSGDEGNKDVTLTNGKQKMWLSYYAYYSKNGGEWSVSFEYEAKEEGDYRVDFIYTTTKVTNRFQSKWNVTVYCDNKKHVNDMDWYCYEQYQARNIEKFHLTKGKHTFKLVMPGYMTFLQATVKPIEIIVGTNYNDNLHMDNPTVSNTKLTLKTFNIKMSEDFTPDEFTVTFQYWHGLDDEKSRSGFVFDAMDEVDFYIHTPQSGEGVKRHHVFGGYVSTVTVDDDLTVMTLNCAGRLDDLDWRYIYPEYVLLGGDKDINEYEDEYYDTLDDRNTINYYNLKSYEEVMKHLLTHPEIRLKNNISSNGTIGNTKYNTPIRSMFYGKNKTKITKTMMTNVTSKDMGHALLIRNGKKMNTTDKIVLWKHNKNGIKVNNAPTFYIQYGMGEAVSSTKLTDTQASSITSGKISNSISKQAKNINTKTTVAGIKEFWKWIHKNINGEYNRSGFYQSPKKTLKRMKGNCCCQTELLFDMCESIGLFKAGFTGYFIHVSNHVYAMFQYKNSKGNTQKLIVDPTSRSGWGKPNPNYRGLKTLQKTKYPKRPFGNQRKDIK